MPRSSSGHVSALLAALAVTFAASAAEVDPALPPYVPQPAAVPAHAGYVRPDGTIAIVGYNDMAPMLEGIDARFTAAHPGVHFALSLKGTATGAPALTHGVTLLAPVGAEFSPLELVPYRKIVGTEPLLIRVAHATPDPKAKSGPLAIIVHRENPLAELTLAQLGAIFGGGERTIETWAQLGLRDGAGRPIHPCGLAEETALGAFLQRVVLHGQPFGREFDGFEQSADVVRRVSDDPAAIGFASANALTPGVKVVAIAARAGERAVVPSAETIAAGGYPLDRFLYLALRRDSAGAADPVAREYVRLVLSRDGQQVIAEAPPHYLPLRADEAAAELAKLP